MESESKQIEELFSALIAIPSRERSRAIAAAKYPPRIKRAATKLVSAFESKSDLLNEDLISDITKLDHSFFDVKLQPDSVFHPGDRIQNYVIQSVIGEGGMSVVYLATQESPIKRTVAIKVIRPSLLAPITVLRFFKEQQALALVGHPNIATLYEVGTTSEGLPFAVIEYVDGMPITQFCENLALSLRERIQLFTKACIGLQHAHRHGIVHRDIKPDNIIVGLENGKPIPKLIDFGIAKINRGDLADNPTMTKVGQILGSPRYMSPEQYDQKPVDARSDVYSAGLILFEMLANSPYRQGDATNVIIDRAKIVASELLSERIRRQALESAKDPETGKTKTKNKNNSTSKLISFCKRDLNWILQKTLALDPDDRYQDVASLVKDLNATLNNQPVSVSAPSLFAQSRKFVSSNLRSLGIVALLTLAIATSIGIYNWKNSQTTLSAVRNEQSRADQRRSAANNLIMRLLASDQYEVETDEFDKFLIPIYHNQYKEIQAKGGPRTPGEKTVVGILAVLHAMSGDFDRADQLMDQIDDEQKSELRHVRAKICEKYATKAKEKLAVLNDLEDGEERAMQQVILARCYIVLDTLDEAKRLLKKSIKYYDSEKPNSYNTLVASNTLILIYSRSGESKEYLKLLNSTYDRFIDEEVLKKDERGRAAIDRLAKWFEESENELK